MRIERLSKTEWDQISCNAHVAVFKEIKPAYTNRIDYALLMLEEKKIIGFGTVRELDDESIYWQYGGALEEHRNTPATFRAYCLTADYCFAHGVNNITTIVENTNLSMLKFALKIGFLIIGTKTLDNKVYLDLHLTREDYVTATRKTM